MKSKFAMASSTAIIVVATALAGCTITPPTAEQHRQHHPESTASQGRMGMAGSKGMMMSDADMKSMCQMHEQMMRAKTPEERKAIMAEHMKSMSPEMRQRHMEMMQSHMQMMQDYMKNQPPGQ
jgi:uncharacterized protein (DUF3084 family)